ncbi:caspase-14-like isoform X3 [Cebus imitator]|uniref:caspase-14-like isoform X3 n=1 Tax=Cebus imitator TaxID=2715852 RepID=UPI0018998079|nr:caspase-14-like isoform X3 [Cebus imitator]
MAFLVAGTLRVATQMADTQDSLGRKGRYNVQGPRAALMLSSPGVAAVAVTALKDVFQALGFESFERREVPVQGFLEELAWFRERLDAHGHLVGCALVALVAPRGQLWQPQQLVRELSSCGVLQGCPKVFLLLPSGPGATLEPEAFLDGLRELCSHCPHWSLVQLLTEPAPGPSTQYDLSKTRAALLLAVIQGRPGAQHDVEALGDLCRALGFETTVKTDPTAQAFQEEIAQFREQLDTCRGPVSCALVALMAHGGPRGQLLGADGQEVQPEALMQELSCCPVLRGHPKIFLLQACRGGNRDAGVRPIALPWYRRWLRTPPSVPSHADVLQIYAEAQDSSGRGPASGSSHQADILTVYAAAEGYVAYRDEKGSDFIQTLVEVLRANPGRDLLEVLTEVNRRVCEQDVLGPDCDEPRKACLEICSSLRRRLCLQA